MLTCKFKKENSFTYAPSCILPLFSKSASRLRLSKRLLKCAGKISFRKYNQKVVLLLIYLFNYNSIKSISFMLNMAFHFSWVYKDYKNIHFFQTVFWYIVLFDKKLNVLHYGEYFSILFWYLCQTLFEQ